jgi:hypothetical protein
MTPSMDRLSGRLLAHGEGATRMWHDPATIRWHPHPMSLRALLFKSPSPLRSPPQVLEIAFAGQVYSVRLRRNAQARRYTLRVQAATREVVLTVPPRGTLKEAKAFAERNGAWIAARLGRLPQPIPFAEGVEIPVRGVPHRIVHRPGARGTAWIESDTLCVAGSRPRAGATRRRSASRRAASSSATRPAAGARARPPACSAIRGA